MSVHKEEQLTTEHQTHGNLDSTHTSQVFDTIQPDGMEGDGMVSKEHATDEANCASDDEPEVVITGQTTCNTPKRKRVLTLEERDSIFSPNHMLTDISINTAQNILHEQFPLCEGLEDTVLGPVLQFSVAGNEFAQILHDGRLHWVAASNIGCQKGHIKFYDSLDRGNINMAVKKQIACIMKEECQKLTIHIQPVQQQSNGSDCGLLALAFITSLLHGQDPAGATYDNQQLRPHLLSCLTEGNMAVFPASNKDCSRRCPAKEIMLDLFCHCRMPWSKKDAHNHHTQMAECDTCKEWYQRSCLNIPQQVFQTDCSWECPKCAIVKTP